MSIQETNESQTNHSLSFVCRTSISDFFPREFLPQIFIGILLYMYLVYKYILYVYITVIVPDAYLFVFSSCTQSNKQ